MWDSTRGVEGVRNRLPGGSDTLLAVHCTAVSDPLHDPLQKGVRSHAKRDEGDQTPGLSTIGS